LGEPEGVGDFALADQFNEALLLEMEVEDGVLVQDLPNRESVAVLRTKTKEGDHG
jgi:hypothetical protein